MNDELEPEETDSPLPCPFLTLLIIQSCTTKTSGIIIQGWAAGSLERMTPRGRKAHSSLNYWGRIDGGGGNTHDCLLEVEALKFRSSLDAEEMLLDVEQHNPQKLKISDNCSGLNL